MVLPAAGGILVWQALTDVNRNSIHPFYKERLSSAFAVRRVDADHAEEVRYARPIRLLGVRRTGAAGTAATPATSRARRVRSRQHR